MHSSHLEPAAGAFLGKVHWVREEMVGRRRREGWEVVVIDDGGRPVATGERLAQRTSVPAATGTYAYESAPVVTRKRKAGKER